MFAQRHANRTDHPDAEQRIYSCTKCGYRMRFGTSRCSDCWEKAPVYNQRWFWRLLYGTCAAMLAVAVIWVMSAFL
ncbi:hypothetical protein FALB51S_02037 [Frigidibacter albus]|uniref:Uncharacterized protein n=1 Tax=Frigidibacter mobilis TaxID=1335048 RepID=A0A161GJE5_9RHOB|nr:hypothetical protein AKL17_1096 [Frigidibacter mobilis]